METNQVTAKAQDPRIKQFSQVFDKIEKLDMAADKKHDNIFAEKEFNDDYQQTVKSNDPNAAKEAFMLKLLKVDAKDGADGLINGKSIFAEGKTDGDKSLKREFSALYKDSLKVPGLTDILSSLGINLKTNPNNKLDSDQTNVDSLGIDKLIKQVATVIKPPRHVTKEEVNDIRANKANSAPYISEKNNVSDLDSKGLDNIISGDGVKDIKPGVYGGVKLDANQVNNAKIIAATIIQVGKKKNQSPAAMRKAVVIALATAMQESTLRNLDHGDRDSVGLFQQRPSCGWGSKKQCQNPVYAAGKFAEALYKTEFNDKSVSAAAQKVQRSAFPDAYGKWQQMAIELASKLLP
jgi:hypothetical protein